MQKPELHQATLLAAALFLASALSASGQGNAARTPKNPKEQHSISAGVGQAPSPRGTNAAPAKRPVYKPPQRGAPEVRVNAGSRGTGDPLPALYVLSPNQAGQTSQEQPPLYWYLTQPTQARIEISLFQENQAKPLLELALKESPKAGIQKLQLAKEGAKLEPDREYQWVVAVVADPANRSKDVVASGVIKRIRPAAALGEQIAQADPARLPFVYAENGLWFDAVASIMGRLEAHPGDPGAVDQINGLLEQVGLKDVKISP